MININNDLNGATPLDLDEIAGLKFKHITTKSELDHLEQANIEDGLLWMSKIKNIDILNEAFIKKLHLNLFGQVWKWAGVFRKTEKNIGVDPYNIAVELHKLLADVKFWIEHKTFTSLEVALRLHHRLVFIHLFPNGNGRHARIMADLLLIKVFNEKPINWTKGYDLWSLNVRRNEYILALRAADKGDYQVLLKFAS